MDQEVPIEQLEEAYKIMAGIVRCRGARFLPIFKRLHEELQERKAQQDLISIALQVARDALK